MIKRIFYVILVAISTFIIGWGVINEAKKQKGIEITIFNQSSEKITDAELQYYSEKVKIPELKNNSYFKTTLKTSDKLGESEVKLVIKNQKFKKDILVCGYIEPSSNGESLVILKQNGSAKVNDECYSNS